MGKKFHIRKRMFLNRSEQMSAFVLGVVEDTSLYADDGDKWKWGTITLKLADCFDTISFDFSMDTAEARRDSLIKIRRMAEVINGVRDAIEKESESISKRSKPGKASNKQ